MNSKIRWGVIGTGNIAHVFAKAMITFQSGKLYAVASREKIKSELFCKQYKMQKNYSDYIQLLSDPMVDAVYIALPSFLHAEWIIKSAKAKKHILCEKPLCLNQEEALLVSQAVSKNNVFIMEAFLFRDHPQTLKLLNLISDGVIGNLRLIDSVFSFRLNSNEKNLQSIQPACCGSIYDVGCYTTMMSGLIAGIESNYGIIEPSEVYGVAWNDCSNLDLCSLGVFKYPNGILAKVTCSILTSKENYLKVYGDLGTILVESPWVPGGRTPSRTKIKIKLDSKCKNKIINLDNNYCPTTYMIKKFTSNLKQKSLWGQYLNEALINIKTIDKWRCSKHV